MTPLKTSGPDVRSLFEEKGVVGPQNPAELALFDLVMEGLNSTPAVTTTSTELAAELRARIRSKR